MSKLENPARLMELKPRSTLLETGLNKDDIFCDIGAGTGIFTIEAAKITNAKTYAVDVSEDMLKVIEDKAAKHNLKNIELINPETFNYPIETNQCDFIMLCTVLHEIDDKSALLNEIYRILKRSGRLIIIEFFKKQTPMGPPANHRISIDETMALADEFDFNLQKQSSLGENLYILVFRK